MSMLSNAFRRGLWLLVITVLAVHARAAERPVVGLDRYYNHATRDAKPCRYAWEDTSDGGYSELARLIQGLGAETVSVDQPASKQSLAGLDVYLVVAPNAPGVGEPQRKGMVGRIANPWHKDSFNLTEAIRLESENPTLAASLKEAAGYKE